MVRIEDAIVKDGQITLPRLPFPDGARVTVTVDERPTRKTIEEIRERLRGSVIRYDDPCEPVLEEDWDMLK